MKLTIRNQAPRTRCYKCGDPELVAICHHCGRAMCHEHRSKARPRWLLFLENLEFTELGLNEQSVGTRGTHCEDCLHFLIPYVWIAFWAFSFLVLSVLINRTFLLQPRNPYFQIWTWRISLFYLFVSVFAVLALTPIAFFLFNRYRARFKKNLLLIVAEVQQIITKDCRHFLNLHRWIVFSTIGFLILSELISRVFRSQLGDPYIQIWAWTVSLICLFFSVIVLTPLSLLLVYRYETRLKRNRPPLPIAVQVQQITIREVVEAHIELDAKGNYKTSSRPKREKGTIKFSLKFSPLDHERLNKYRKKFKSEPVRFHAGFAVLKGAADLRFDNDIVVMKDRINTIELGEEIADQPFLSGTGSGHTAHWQIEYPYTFKQTKRETAGHLPIQIMPRVVHEGGKWALELMVQINPKMQIPELFTGKAFIQELTLYTSMKLGKIERTDPPAIRGHEDEKNPNGKIVRKHKIAWKQLSLEKDPLEARYKRFYARFANSISPKTSSRISGQLRIRFDYSFSGLEDIDLFYPLGNKRPPEDTNIEKYTEATLNFDLDLRSLCFPEMLIEQEPPIVRENVIPDHRMLKQLINAFCESGIYVQRVIENPPRTNRANAQIINRFWDIAGRQYRGVYPIDFHLVLIGQERYGKADEPDAGRTHFEITVQGTVTNKEMRKNVEDLMKQLKKISEKALKEAPQLPHQRPLGEEPNIPSDGFVKSSIEDATSDTHVPSNAEGKTPQDDVSLIKEGPLDDIATDRNNGLNGAADSERQGGKL